MYPRKIDLFKASDHGDLHGATEDIHLLICCFLTHSSANMVNKIYPPTVALSKFQGGKLFTRPPAFSLIVKITHLGKSCWGLSSRTYVPSPTSKTAYSPLVKKNHMASCVKSCTLNSYHKSVLNSCLPNRRPTSTFHCLGSKSG